MEWSVSLEFTGDGTIRNEDMLEALELLDPYAPVGTHEPGMYGFTISVDTPTAIGALKESEALVVKAAHSAGLPDWPLVKTTIQSGDDLERELQEPNYPELLGVTELAELLEVSRQRASELSRLPHFPAPMAHLTATPVWDRRTIGNFLKEWNRSPGRPKTVKVPTIENPAVVPEPEIRQN